jgi:disease resistance protein RPS2
LPSFLTEIIERTQIHFLKKKKEKKKKKLKQEKRVAKSHLEVASLKHLISLSVCFPGMDYLKTFISIFPLWKVFYFKFLFSVGSHDQTRYKIFDNTKYQMRRCLKFENGGSVNHAISEVLAQSDAFELIGHKGVSKLSYFGVDNINMMRGTLFD